MMLTTRVQTLHAPIVRVTPDERRRMLYPELKERAGSKAGALPAFPPEVKSGLMYTNAGWIIRRNGLALPDRIPCRAPKYAPHLFKVHQHPRELVQPCTHRPTPADQRCNTLMFVVGFKPPFVWAMDLAPHEELIVSLLSHEEILDWFEVGFPTNELRCA